MSRNLSFTSINHPIHSKTWMIEIVNQGQKSTHCLSCLIEIIENINISKVQRHVVLGLINSALVNDCTAQLLASQNAAAYHLMCLVLDIYSDELNRQTATSLCVSLIHKLQDETLYHIFIEKLQTTALSMPSGDNFKLCLLVLNQLLSTSSMYSEMMIISNAQIIIGLLHAHLYMDESTLNLFIVILTQLIQSIHSSPLLQADDTELFIWKIMEAFIVWINTLQSYDLMVSCLGLLKECIRSERLATGLLVAGDEHNVLMGLKRILATKDSTLIISGTQCLTLLMDTLQEPVQMKDVFDTDIADFIFEFLHTSNISQLESTLLCLLTMARQSQFYYKCHAVYGIDSVLNATRVALNGRKIGIIDKCLTLLTCFLERQPDTIPLFVNHSWNTCCELLLECLRSDMKEITLKTLQTTAAFLRPQHVQSPVNIKCVASVLTAVENIFHRLVTDVSGNQQAVFMMTCISTLVISLESILQCNTTLYGNETETVVEVKAMLKHLCYKWIVFIISDFWDYVRDQKRFNNFMTCLYYLLSTIQEDIDISRKIFSTGLPFQILALSSGLQMTDENQRLLCHNLTNMCLQVARTVKPSIQINPTTMVSGIALLKFPENLSMLPYVQGLKVHDEIVAFFTLVYLSYLFGHQCCQEIELPKFLEIMQRQHAGLLSLDKVVARAYVFLSAYHQGDNINGNVIHENTALKLLEKFPIEYWFTFDVRVFQWSLATQRRTQAVGSKLVEYWILNLQLSTSSSVSIVNRLDEANKLILQSLTFNQHFLFSVINILDMDNWSAIAKDILIHGISHLSLTTTGQQFILTMESLFHQTIQKFNSTFIQQLTYEDTLLKSYLSVLCAMITSPLCSSVDKACCLKPVCHVLKLLTKDVNDIVELSFQFISSVVVALSLEDSKAVIPLLLKNENFISSLEFYVRETKPFVTHYALVIAGWLALHGKNYQAHRPVLIPSQCLLDYIATCRSTSLPILQLLHAGLLAMTSASTAGALRLVKIQHNFVSSRVFSLHELQQIYIYLQQFVVQKNEKLRLEAVCCIQKLECLGPDIFMVSSKSVVKLSVSVLAESQFLTYSMVLFSAQIKKCGLGQHIYQQPWNPVMLQSMLSVTQNGLSESDIDLCFLLSTHDQHIWTSTIADSFLLALLNSNLTAELQNKAKVILQQIKLAKVGHDTDLFDTAEECLNNILT